MFALCDGSTPEITRASRPGAARSGVRYLSKTLTVRLTSGTTSVRPRAAGTTEFLQPPCRVGSAEIIRMELWSSPVEQFLA